MEGKESVAKTVDEYLSRLPEDKKVALEQLRQTIKAAATMAQEVISYQIPTYKHHGALVHFAAFKNHCSFFGVGKGLLKTFEKELKDFKVSGTTIHFSPEKPLPKDLVERMVAVRIAENENRASLKKQKTTKKQ